jgi:glutathione S-transferase
MFAALNSMEVVIQPLAEVDLFFSKKEWAPGYRSMLDGRVKTRLKELAAYLGDKAYLEGEFTAGDLLMTTVLRILGHTEYVKNEPRLAAYQSRCEARPAFQRALGAQLASFEKR